jgi:hypothetical protein
MVLATFGVLAPVAGAFFQEAIDVAVILNALRALSGGELRGSPADEIVTKEPLRGEDAAATSKSGAQVTVAAGR